MSTHPAVIESNAASWTLPSRGKVGMVSLIIAESAIFTIFIAAYIFYIGKSISDLLLPVLQACCDFAGKYIEQQGFILPILLLDDRRLLADAPRH